MPAVNFKFDPEKVMKMAIKLAKKAQYQTEPNPVVGAVLVNESGQILADGFHEKAGSPHAEVMALRPYAKVPSDAILFVTLEPCNHSGKTPPCVDLILKKDVKTVVVGTKDPNPQVSGKGIHRLKSSGVKVIEGICRSQCQELNKVFNKHIVEKIPFVTVKAAITLDGKIAMPSGESQWITGESARRHGHQLRSQHQAMAVGSKTLIHDNPRLTNRVAKLPRQPHKVVFSSRGQLPMTTHFFQDRNTRRFVIAGNQIASGTVKQLESTGAEVLVADTARPTVIWALKTLYTYDICSLLLEGGSELIGAFIREKMVDQLYLFLAGKVIGRESAPSWCGETNLELLSQSPMFRFDRIEKLGDDLLLICTPKNQEV